MTDSESQFNQVRSDHLILLVGGNPLPNAVSACLLLKQGGRVTLIYSKGSLDVARRLADWLRQRLQAVIDPVNAQLCVQEQEPASIYNRVQSALNQYEDSAVGLNYTGGTKAMAVHAYRAVEAWAASNNRSAIFSYLDARTNCMFFDASPWVIPVDLAVSLELQDMLALHGWTLDSMLKPVQTPILPGTARAIAAAYVAGCGSSSTYYAEWKRDELYPNAQKQSGHDWKSNVDLRQTAIAWPAGRQLAAVAQALKQETGLDNQPQLHLGLAGYKVGLSAVDFCRWLDGLWLEHHVLDVLTHNLRLKAFQGVKIKTHGASFDLDVVTVVGHHLFAFSCGTAIGKRARSELKLKLFEAVLRARQLGGDHAGVALVTVVDSSLALSIQNEVRQQIDADERIRVFDCAQLGQLDQCISHWIFGEQVKSKC